MMMMTMSQKGKISETQVWGGPAQVCWPQASQQKRQYKTNKKRHNARKENDKNWKYIYVGIFRFWVWLCKGFQSTFDNAHWRKAWQMQTVFFSILFWKSLEETLDDIHWKKPKGMKKSNWRPQELILGGRKFVFLPTPPNALTKQIPWLAVWKPFLIMIGSHYASTFNWS